jgi:CRISPR/Cas system endoribonuclease Cas6 (RAMP superfamily)
MVGTDRSGEQAVETLDDWTRQYGSRRSTAAAGGGRYFLNGVITARIVQTKGIASDAEALRQLAEVVGITLPGDAG